MIAALGTLLLLIGIGFVAAVVKDERHFTFHWDTYYEDEM